MAYTPGSSRVHATRPVAASHTTNPAAVAPAGDPLPVRADGHAASEHPGPGQVPPAAAGSVSHTPKASPPWPGADPMMGGPEAETNQVPSGPNARRVDAGVAQVQAQAFGVAEALDEVPFPAPSPGRAAVQEVLGEGDVVVLDLAIGAVDAVDVVLLGQRLGAFAGQLLLGLGLGAGPGLSGWPGRGPSARSRAIRACLRRGPRGRPSGRTRRPARPPASPAGRRPPCAAASSAESLGVGEPPPGSAHRRGTAAGRRPAPRPRRTACAGSFCRHFSAIVSRSRGTPRHQPRRRHRLGRLDLLERLQDRRPPERRAAGQQLVQDRPQRVDVGERADLPGLPLGLLRGHVAGRAQDRLGRVRPDSASRLLARPKSVTLGVPSAASRTLRRLQVAVDDPRRCASATPRASASTSAAARRAGQGVPSRRRPGCRRRRIPARGTAGRRARRCRGPGRRWGAGAWRRPRPRRGSGRRRGVGVGAGQDHLQGAGAVQADLPGPVDDAHAAAAELALDQVAGDRRRRALERVRGRPVGVRRDLDPSKVAEDSRAGSHPPWTGADRPAGECSPEGVGGTLGPRSASVASGSGPRAPIVPAVPSSRIAHENPIKRSGSVIDTLQGLPTRSPNSTPTRPGLPRSVPARGPIGPEKGLWDGQIARGRTSGRVNDLDSRLEDQGLRPWSTTLAQRVLGPPPRRARPEAGRGQERGHRGSQSRATSLRFRPLKLSKARTAARPRPRGGPLGGGRAQEGPGRRRGGPGRCQLDRVGDDPGGITPRILLIESRVVPGIPPPDDERVRPRDRPGREGRDEEAEARRARSEPAATEPGRARH